jgi:PEP-CTERM motif
MNILNGRTLFHAARTRISLLCALLMLTGAAQAIPLLDVTTSLNANDPTQLGRLTRDGVPSDWSMQSAFPGVLNPNVAYAYRTFTLNVQTTSFIQVLVDSSIDLFVSAYLDSYQPNALAPDLGLSTNYLGDAGSSGTLFGNPLFFQVVVPAFSQLVLVVNDTSAVQAGLQQPFRLLVEGFLDTEFTEPVPEPATLALLLIALASLGCARRRAQG